MMDRKLKSLLYSYKMHLDWIFCTVVGDKVSGKYFILQDKVDLHAEMVHAHTMVYGWVDGALFWRKKQGGGWILFILQDEVSTK